MNKVSVYLVFIEGIASFLSPCLLPLLPLYIGYLSGEITHEKSNKKVLIKNALIFCAGLSLIFILMGTGAGSIGFFLNRYKRILIKISAVIIIIFGLFIMGIIKLNFLYRERKFNMKIKSADALSSFIFGMTFALGWTPCIGPILSSVLIIAGSTGSTVYGAYLLMIYALGLSIPFVITAAFIEYISSKLKSIQKYSVQINFISGLLLIFLGMALYFGWLQRLSYL